MNVVEGIILAGLILLAFLDIKKREIPVVPVVAAGVMLVVYRLCTGAGTGIIAVGLLPGLVMMFLSFCTRGGIGVGDGLVLCVLGVGCGVEQAVAVLGLAFVLAALTAAILLATGKAGRKTEFPFLPCVLAGYIIGLLW